MKTHTTNKPRVNITIDPIILEIFNSLEPVHGYEYISNFVEDRMKDLIKEYAPDKLLEMQIKEYEAKVAEMKDSLPDVRFAAKKLRESKLNENSKMKSDFIDESKLEKRRQEMFQKHLPALKFQTENRRPYDWSKLQDDLEFKTKAETIEYVNNKLEFYGVI